MGWEKGDARRERLGARGEELDAGVGEDGAAACRLVGGLER